MHDDATHLRRFAEDGDESAFAALVQCHLGLVYAAALRQLNGDAHLAKDVAQSVFADLARKAASLARGAAPLEGWLYTSTHHAAANAVRTEQRRRRREQEAHAMQELSGDPSNDAAWARVRPELDAVMQRLKREDREAIVQRYFGQRSFAEVGTALGVSESGARMRVERALEKLRQQLERRGIRSTMAALGAVLATEAAAAPPVGLAASVTAAALAKAGGTALAAGTLGILGMTKIQTAITATAAVAGLALVGVEIRNQRQARADLAELRALGAHDASSIDTPPVEPGRSVAGAAAQEPAQLADLRAEKAALVAEMQRRGATKPAAATAPARANKSAATQVSGEETMVDFKALDVKPAPVKQTPPQYPAMLRGIPGEAMVSYVITASGEVADVQPEDATHPAFALAAMDAVAQWKFSPGEKDGVSVNTRVVQPLRFVWTEDDWF